MKTRWVPLLLLAGALLARPVRGQEACKTVTLKNPAVKLSEMWAMADKAAKAWKADAVPARISNTSLGPLQPDDLGLDDLRRHAGVVSHAALSVPALSADDFDLRDADASA